MQINISSTYIEESSKKLLDTLRSMYWYEVPDNFVIFDLETTGLRAGTDRILEIGAIAVDKKKFLESGDLETFECFIKQDKPIPKHITKINHITDEMVANGLTETEALNSFFEFSKGNFLLAFNSPFDVNFLNATAKRTNYPIESEELDSVQDIYRLAKKYIPRDQLQNRKLITIAESIGIKTQSSHRALADSLLAFYVYIYLKQIEFGEENADILQSMKRLCIVTGEDEKKFVDNFFKEMYEKIAMMSTTNKNSSDIDGKIADDKWLENVADSFAKKRQAMIEQQAIKDNAISQQAVENTIIKKTASLDNEENNTTVEESKYSVRILIIIFIFMGLLINVFYSSFQEDTRLVNIKPSFDCSKAKNKTETKICSEPTLVKLDFENAELHKKFIQINSTKAKQLLNNFIQTRNKCQADYDCIKSNFKQSIDSYKSLINSNSSFTNKNQADNQTQFNPYKVSKCSNCGYSIAILVKTGSLTEVDSTTDRILNSRDLESLSEKNRYLGKFQGNDKKWRIDVGRFEKADDAEIFETKLKRYGENVYTSSIGG